MARLGDQRQIGRNALAAIDYRREMIGGQARTILHFPAERILGVDRCLGSNRFDGVLAVTQSGQIAIKAIAAKATINARDPLSGEMKDRPGLAADHFAPVVYGGKGVPPDLSLITKAREGGAAYVYSLLTGYAAQPAKLAGNPETKTPDGLYYNPYFANLNIAMPPPLASDGLVTYSDGVPATRDQMAKDVSAFLTWTAEPKLEARHQAGFMWIGLMLFVTVLSFLAYRNIWSGTKH